MPRNYDSLRYLHSLYQDEVVIDEIINILEIQDIQIGGLIDSLAAKDTEIESLLTSLDSLETRYGLLEEQMGRKKDRDVIYR